jgi:hypothetical protein
MTEGTQDKDKSSVLSDKEKFAESDSDKKVAEMGQKSEEQPKPGKATDKAPQK